MHIAKMGNEGVNNINVAPNEVEWQGVYKSDPERCGFP
jgi:hypothetical protein